MFRCRRFFNKRHQIPACKKTRPNSLTNTPADAILIKQQRSVGFRLAHLARRRRRVNIGCFRNTGAAVLAWLWQVVLFLLYTRFSRIPIGNKAPPAAGLRPKGAGSTVGIIAMTGGAFHSRRQKRARARNQCPNPRQRSARYQCGRQSDGRYVFAGCVEACRRART